jgi:hypothetical protein
VEVEVVGQVEDGGRTEDGWWFIILGLLELEIAFWGCWSWRYHFWDWGEPSQA